MVRARVSRRAGWLGWAVAGSARRVLIGFESLDSRRGATAKVGTSWEQKAARNAEIALSGAVPKPLIKQQFRELSSPLETGKAHS